MYPDLLRCFTNHGHHVLVICARERRHGLPTQITKECDIDVLRIRTGNITKTNILEKGITTIIIGTQFKLAIKKHVRDIKFDLILYATPPITLVNTIRYIKKRDQACAYLMLKDIFPQNALDLGILKKSGWRWIVTAYFQYKEKSLYQISDRIGCMSQANIEYVKTHYDSIDCNKLEICPNTIDPSIKQTPNIIYLREKYQIPLNKIIFICCGNFGKPQDVAFIIQVLKNNKSKNDRHFVICGSGTDYYKLQELDNEIDKNVSIYNYKRKEELGELIGACDVGLIFLDHRFTIPNYPSRILDYMNLGLPIFAATDCNSDIGVTILDGGFGWWCESNDIKMYQNILDDICIRKEELEGKKENSRQYLIKYFNTEIAYERIKSACDEREKNRE